MAQHRRHFRDRSGQRGLPVVDVAHRAHVQMRLIAYKFFLSHASISLLKQKSIQKDVLIYR
jgi:hypothetical protein